MKTELATTLKRQTAKVLAELQTSKEPVLITEHGKPAAYLVDVEEYEFSQHKIQILEEVARGEADIAAGRTMTHEQAKDKLKKWLK